MFSAPARAATGFGFAAIPRGTPHAFRNFEATPLRMVVLLTPGGFEQFMPAMKGRPTDAPLAE